VIPGCIDIIQWCNSPDTIQQPFGLPGSPVGLKNLDCEYLTLDGNTIGDFNRPYETGQDQCREEIVVKEGFGGFLASFTCKEGYARTL